MKKSKLNEQQNDLLNEMTATYLEQVCKLFGREHIIDDVEWELVYDLKAQVLEEILPQLGLSVELEEDSE